MSSVVIKICKQKEHGTTITIPISKKIASLLRFAFVDDADLVTAARNTCTSDVEMIQKMQALMTEWCGCIRATGGYIAPAKTRWFLIFFWTGTNWEYETKDLLPGDITLTDQDDNEYIVSRKEPTTAFESLGVPLDLAKQLPDSLNAVTKICHIFATQIKNAKCNKTSCLNKFNTSIIPTLSYRMISTQFTEQQWNKAIRPAIQATRNTAGMAKNISHAILHGPLDYQGIGVKNPYFLQGFIHIIAFLNKGACNSSTGELL